MFEVWSDHLNLQYFRKPQKLNCRQVQWKTELQEFRFILIHKPNPQMKKADLIMRRADFKMGENDNTNITLLKEDLFISVINVEPIADELMKRNILLSK